MKGVHPFAASVCLLVSSCGLEAVEPDTGASLSEDIPQIETLQIADQPVLETLTPEETARRAAQSNLLMLNQYVTFLEQVKLDTGHYPETRKSMRSAFNAMKEQAQARDVTLPEKPVMMGEDSKARFAYRSDGTDYKLVAERTGDCFAVREIEPVRIDPKRASGPVDCYGYGFWTEGAVTW